MAEEKRRIVWGALLEHLMDQEYWGEMSVLLDVQGSEM